MPRLSASPGLFKRGNVWWIRFTTPGGRKIRTSTGTASRERAQELLDTAKAQAWRLDIMGEKPPHTWDEAAAKWLDEKLDKRDFRGDVQKIAWLTPHFSEMPLRTMTRDKIMAVARLKLQESSPATANRYLALIRAIFRAAHAEWQWIEASEVPMLKLFREPEGRVRWLEWEQVESLLRHLPRHQRLMALFALATGLRQSNVKGLKWEQINMTRRIAMFDATAVKNGRPLGISLNDLAMQVLNTVKGQHPEYVFTFRGRPVTQINTKAWQKAVEAAGITDFRWHDLRHTWASWLRQSGVDLATIQEMGGWKDPKMTQRYAHLEVAHLAPHAGAIDKHLKSSGGSVNGML